MAIDTIKLRSPSIDEGTASYLERQCILKQGVELATGEILYEITMGNLQGSWDSRISFKVEREEWLSVNGRLEQMPCQPYVTVECSIHKFFHGQNVFGGPVGFRDQCNRFVDFLGEIFQSQGEFSERGRHHELFHVADRWEVRRVDWAEMFRLTPAAQMEFFRSLKNAQFPRRRMKEAKYATAVHYPGAYTTVRIYGKGQEFKEHDAGRVRKSLTAYAVRQVAEHKSKTHGGAVMDRAGYQWVDRKMAALQRLADNRLRAEVQINADKLRHDWGGRFPLVSEMTDQYLQKVFDAEMFKLIKEGKSEMETVRTYDRVKARLNATEKSKRGANNLLAFWMQMSARGEAVVKLEYSQSQFYANRKRLVDAGISWNNSDVFIVPQETALPNDFRVLIADPRRCARPVSANSIFNLCPVEQAELRKAA